MANTSKPYMGITAERDGYVGWLRLESPDTRNALTPEVVEALSIELEAFDSDPDVRCVVVSGTQEVFASGGDEQGQGSLADSAWLRISGCTTPIVAAVSGYAIEAGFELALLCDLVVASETAELGLPQIMLGLVPGGGATQRLVRALGKHRAMELVLTGRRIDAHEAHRMGIVNTVAGKKQWLDRAGELAAFVAARPPAAVQLAKSAVLAAAELSLREGIGEESRLGRLARGSDDRREALAALAEKRRPKFTGR